MLFQFVDDNGQIRRTRQLSVDSILFFPLPFLTVTATAELMAAGFDVDGIAAGLLPSLAIIFSNDDLMVGSSMSPRISFSLKTSRARMLAEAAMVDWEASAGEIKESRFPSGLTQTQETLLLVAPVFASLPAWRKFMVNRLHISSVRDGSRFFSPMNENASFFVLNLSPSRLQTSTFAPPVAVAALFFAIHPVGNPIDLAMANGSSIIS